MNAPFAFGKVGMRHKRSKSAPDLVSAAIRRQLGPVNRPRISCNLAISADGKISSPGHRPSDWTSAEDLQRLKQLRRGAGALMVGRGTVETDNMTMTVENQEQQPLRCIVSRHGKLPENHPLFSSEGGDIHLLATEGYKGERRDKLTIHECSLPEFLELLHQKHGVKDLHCEGGGQLIRALVELDALDEVHLTWAAHSLLGGAQSPTLSGVLGDHFTASKAFELTGFEPQATTGECFLTYRRKA